MRKFLFALLAAPLLFGACSDDNDESTPTLSFAKPVLALSTGSVTLDLQVSGVDLSSLASPVTVPVAFSGTAVKGSEYSVSAEQFILGGNNQSLSITPSSLTVVLPIASVCSTRPPVSVLVRAPTALPRGFSRKHGLTGFAQSLRLASQAPCAADFHAARPTRFHGDVQNPARLPFSVAPSVMPRRRRCGNVCPLRIGYASRPRLSSRLTLGGLASPRNP